MLYRSILQLIVIMKLIYIYTIPFSNKKFMVVPKMHQKAIFQSHLFAPSQTHPRLGRYAPSVSPSLYIAWEGESPSHNIPKVGASDDDVTIQK